MALTVFLLAISVRLSTASSGMVSIGKNMQTAIAERPAAVTASLLIAMLLAPLAFLACSCSLQLTLITFTVLPPAVYDATLELAGVGAVWTPYISTVLCALAAIAAVPFVINVSIGIAIDIASRTCHQLTSLCAVPSSFLGRAAPAVRFSVLRAAKPATHEKPCSISNARDHTTHITATAGVCTCTIRAARRTAHALVAFVSFQRLRRCVAQTTHA
eukprot:5421606-Pleurochrysis_carterae.AAC.3